MEVSIQKNTIVGQVPNQMDDNMQLGRRNNSVNINITSTSGIEVNAAEQVIITALSNAGMIVLPEEDDANES